ncbi:hypothetical protein [Streptomyces sp. NPDC049555]|uniref:hypothetical protein n=1 Tax=Streptomyces sp. NPDC049555 TaxID=3154930 RepID=UPI00341D1E62
MPTTTHDAEYQALIAERYGRPLTAILNEAHPAKPLAGLLKERHRRPAPPPPALPARPPMPDPNWAEHRAVLEAALHPRRTR